MANESQKPRWKRIVGWTGYVALCLGAIGAGTAYGWLSQSNILGEGIRQVVAQETPDRVFDSNTLTLLLLGCDEDRTPGGKRVVRSQARSDMMLIAKLDFANQRITGVSIPRDVVVDMPGFRPMRINAFHSIGGEEKGREYAKRAAEFVTGIPIDRVLVLDYQAFQEMVDLIGGVDVFVQKRMKHTDRRGDLYINLQAGRQVLNGYDAMCFVRYRGDSDFMRQQRQKDFLMAFKEGMIGQWHLLPQVVDKAAEVLGDELTDRELVSIALFAKEIGPENVRMGMIPVRELANYDLAIDRSKMEDTLVEFNFKPNTVAQLGAGR
ncbi:MAG: LCP family protein [Fimbriimonadaceae bacterium]